jgi:hypothetical protein
VRNFFGPESGKESRVKLIVGEGDPDGCPVAEADRFVEL